MARFCTNCGARLEASARFCGSCGAPCTAGGSRQTVRSGDTVRRSGSKGSSGSSGWWKFFAGGAIGAFFARLFGSSPSATASAHAERTENFHHTAIYRDDDDDFYFSPNSSNVDPNGIYDDEDRDPAFDGEDGDTFPDSEDFAADDGGFDDDDWDDTDADDGDDDWDDSDDDGDDYDDYDDD